MNSRFRPATAFIATCVLVAELGLDDARREVGVLGRHPSLEHVGRFHEMVVDRDDRVANRARFGVGQQCLGSGDDRHALQDTPGSCEARRGESEVW
jgi:hypothetical protein